MGNNPSDYEEKSGPLGRTPWLGMLFIILFAMFAEILIHIFLFQVHIEKAILSVLVDAGLLGASVCTAAYFAVVRPLLRMSKLLRENQRTLYGYARTASDWFWALGPDLRFIYLSDTFEAVTGRDRDQILGKTWEEIGISSDEGSLDFFFSGIRRFATFRNCELAWKEPSGDLQWFNVTGQPLVSETGKFTGYFGTGNDITLSRYADAEYKRSKALIDGILCTSRDGFFVIGAIRSHDGAIVDFRFIHANDKAGEIVGRHKQDLLGKLFRREIPWMDEGGLINLAIQTVVSGQPFEIERFLNHKWVNGWFRIIGVKLDDGVVITFSDVTSLKSAETSLLDAIESIPEAFALWDTVGCLVVCNSNFREFHATVNDAICVGMSCESLMELAVERDHIVMTCPPEEWLAVRVAEFRDPSPYELHLTDGRWLRVNDQRTADGRTVSIHSDITELKEREQVLLESQARLEEAQRIGHLGWWSLNVTGGLMHWSNEVYHIFGSDNDSFSPTLEHMIAATHSDDRKLLRDTISAAINEQQPFSIEHRIIRSDGSQRILQERGEPRTDHSGATVQILGTILDITERKTIEEELRSSEERYTLAVTGSNEGIWDWNMVANHFYVSPRFKDILGWDHAAPEIPRISLLSQIDPEHAEKYTSRLFDHLAGVTPYFSCEYRIDTGSGEQRWILERGVAVRDSQGNPYRMAGSIADVTERRNAEDRLMHTQKMEALGQLAGGVAHEFNNLLTGISGFARMAQKKPGDMERVKTCLEEVILSADRSAEITRQLLRFSRREEVKPQVIFPSSIITGMRKMLESLLGPKVPLTIRNENTGACCRIDPGQVSQVVMNLAVNARDAMPDGGPLLIGTRVVDIDREIAERTGRTTSGEHFCIYVEDHGTGIEEKVLKRIFEPFFSTKAQGKGTGLGLSITYGIIECAGGFIDVTSTIGQGTTFSVYLPLTTDDSAEVPADTAAPVDAHIGHGETVLVVDDDMAVRKWVMAIVKELGYNVIIATNGVEGLAVAKDHQGRIDLVLTDVIMPQMGGVEMASKIGSVRPEAKILFMSGYTTRDADGAAPEIPAETLLIKPFTQEKLAEFLRTALDAGE